MHQWVQGVQGRGGGFMTAAEHKYKLDVCGGEMSAGQKMHILQKINVNVLKSNSGWVMWSFLSESKTLLNNILWGREQTVNIPDITHTRAQLD